MPRQYCELSLSRIGASGSQPPAGMRVRCSSLILPEAPPRRKPPSGSTVLARASPKPGRQETYLLVVLQFLTQPGSQYIFAPFAVAPIGQLYLMIHRALGSLRVLPQKLEYGKRRRIAPYVLQHAVGQQQLPECAVPARMDGSSQSRRMWRRRAQSRRRCGWG